MDLFTLTGGFLIGTTLIIPVVYLLSWITRSMVWGTIGGVVILALALSKIKFKRVKLDASALLFLLFSLTFSTWMMFKTFHGNPGGELFVGSNNVFDFGLAVGLMRSISWGANIPFMSPYFSGLPLFYHYFFNFWTALLHYFGVPAVWAINIPSVLSFSALLVVIYYLPQVLAKQKPIVGWIAALLTVTNSSLTFWKLLSKLPTLWHTQSYPFAGPYDGSTISLFVTLNSYVNQRHLAFAVAMGLLLFIFTTKVATAGKSTLKWAASIAIVSGFLILWNIALFGLVVALCILTLLLYRKWKAAAVYALVSSIVGIMWMVPDIRYAQTIIPFLKLYTGGILAKTPTWNILDYLWQNLGILPFVAAIGVIVLPRSMKKIFVPLVFFFVLECILAAFGHRGFEQKSFSFLIIGINTLAALGIGWVWKKMKVAAFLIVFVLMISGVVDLLPIKNEFAYPLVDKDTVPVISWIQKNTQKDAVFVSYSDMIDPVVLAGRKNYFGFFRNIGAYDRSGDVRNIYAGDISLAKARSISYVLVPKWPKSDFPYAVDVGALSNIYEKVYEDEKFIIFRADGSSFPAITIINPIRGNGLGHETDDLTSSLKAQWDVTKQAGVHATWLFQFGALENTGMTEFAKHDMQGEEFGLLFEIDRNFAEKSGVPYRGQVAWYASDGLFLNSYDTSERKRLIDTAFAKFKKTFGYYPKTVGAWWIGGDSLTYMHNRYGVVAAMRASDQFNLDFYSIWGTPWNIPYLAAKTNEGIPAASFNESAKVVILQWAIRDPFKGYADSMFSLQDYPARGYPTRYVDYLSSIFLEKPFGNMVIGLENGGTNETFGRFYKTMLTKAMELQISGRAHIVRAGDYAQTYLKQEKVFASPTRFLSTDYDSKDQSFWYTSENYRALVLKSKDTISLVDLRDYSDKVEEDFAELPNGQTHLRINEPSIIDSKQSPNEKIIIATSSGVLSMNEQDGRVELFAGNDKIADFEPTAVSLFMENGIKTFSFGSRGWGIRPIYIILALYIIYFLFLLFAKKNLRNVWKEYLLLLVPLGLAYPFLVGKTTFLFDKKESVWFGLVSAPGLFPILVTVYTSKILPFLLLFLFHSYKRFLYLGYFALITFMYIHAPYFPLDKTTYIPVAITFVIAMIILIFSIHRKYRLTIPFILLYLGVAILFSRTKLALTSYEIQALQTMKDQNKSILYVEEVDYTIKPIYKAVRPLLYGTYTFGRLLTGKKWEVVMRPENNILKIAGYDNKLIVVPRYLGTDISETETSSLQLKKIFDNAQIAIFEKR